MRGEVISIGDELTSGQRLDTNSQWLSQQLADLGIRTLYHTTVADDLEANRVAFENACRRTDVVISTGGLGPTADDLTRQSIAELLGVPLELHQPSLDHIQQRFARRARPMPESNRIQAMFPRGTRPIHNPHGTAPGIRGDHEGARFYCLPGVPAEMKEMWEQTVQGELITALGTNRQRIRHRRLKCFGVGESDLEQMLPDLIRRGRHPTVGITVSGATITLRITAQGTDDQACLDAIAPTEATIRQCLGELVFGEEDEELHHVVHRQLMATGKRLAVIERATHGLIAGWFAPLEAAGSVPLTMVVSESGSLPKLGLSPHALLNREQDVCDLAAHARDRWDVDYVAVVGDFTHPLGHTDGVCPCAIAGFDQPVAFAAKLLGHPTVIRPRIAKQVLNHIRLAMMQHG